MEQASQRKEDIKRQIEELDKMIPITTQAPVVTRSATELKALLNDLKQLDIE